MEKTVVNHFEHGGNTGGCAPGREQNLFIALSKHLYVLGDERLRYQGKALDARTAGSKLLLRRYVLLDVDTGLLYGEYHLAELTVDAAGFLARAWHVKPDHMMRGFPRLLNVARSLEPVAAKEVGTICERWRIAQGYLQGGFADGAHAIKQFEHETARIGHWLNRTPDLCYVQALSALTSRNASGAMANLWVDRWRTVEAPPDDFFEAIDALYVEKGGWRRAPFDTVLGEPDRDTVDALAPVQLLIYVGMSAHFGLDANGRIAPLTDSAGLRDLYYVVSIRDGYVGLRARLFDAPPDPATVARCIEEAGAAERSSARQAVVASLSAAVAQRFADPGARLASLQIGIRVWPGGTAQRSEARWLDRCLGDIVRELDLFHEAAPSLLETHAWAGGGAQWWVKSADPGESYGERRLALGRLVAATLHARARTGPVLDPAAEPHLTQADGDVEHAAKRRRKIAQSAECDNLNELGEGLWALLRLLSRWHTGESPTTTVADELGALLIRAHVNRLGGRGALDWGYQVRRCVPPVTPDGDLVCRAAFGRLRRGIPAAWLLDAWRLPRPKETDEALLVSGYWIAFERIDVPGGGLLGGVPRHNILNARLNSALGARRWAVGVVERGFYDDRQFRDHATACFPFEFGVGWDSATTWLVDAATSQAGARSRKHWFTGDASHGPSRALVVVVRPVSVGEHDALVGLSRLPELLECAINDVLAESGYPPSIRVVRTLETIDEPFARCCERLRLLLGR